MQPIVDLHRGVLVGYQGLARWEHPRRGRLEAEQFVDLGMEATKLRNAVLIYVAPASRTFALYADTAAHRHVGQPLVQRLAAEMGEHFRRGDFTGGLEHVLRVLSESLAEAFPPDASLGNELSDTIVRD